MFSIIMPMDPDRLSQFKVTKLAYDAMPQEKEFLIPTRYESEIRKYIDENSLGKDVRIFPYSVEGGFNVSKALNIGARNAIYDSIIITCPEVKPITLVLSQLAEVLGTNVVCQVWDEGKHHNIKMSLVNTGFRFENPGMYFLAMFNRADIEKINGWDESFLNGYGYEDDDFGSRWVRANIPFTVRDDIQALHQYHRRGETVPGGTAINSQKLLENNEAGIIICQDGLNKLSV